MAGANSFSGSHFVSRLLTEGHEVWGLGRSPEPAKVFLPRLWGKDPLGKYHFVQLDLNIPDSVLGDFLREVEPEIVVNFAAQGMVAQSWEQPWDWFTTNTSGLSRLLHEVLALPKLKKYLHITTPEVYGSTEGWVPESFNFAPSTPYAVSRAAGDWHVMNLFKVKGLPVVLTRAANVYGPGQQLYRVIPRAFLGGLLNESFPMHGEGLSTRSFIHIDDVVEATYRLSLSDLLGETFHISTNELISIRDLVSQIYDLLGITEAGIVHLPERDGKDQTYQLDSSKIRSELGWTDKVSLLNGLEQVHHWVVDNLPLLRGMPKHYSHKT